MNKYDIESQNFENAVASLESDNSELTLILSGDIDMRDTSIEFLPYLLKIHDALTLDNVNTIKLNLLNLTFMNSNGIKSLINWIMKITELPEKAQYKVHITANKNIAWQESTLPVLQKLFPELIIIDQA